MPHPAELVSRCLSIVACSSAALALAAAGQDGPRDRWTPAAELLAEAGKLADPAARAAWDGETRAREEEDEGPSGRRIDVLRAGLRLPDGPAAVACAARLEEEYLDAWELERVVALLLPRAFEPGTEVDFEKLRFMLGSVDVPALFAAMPEGGPWAERIFLRKAHVYMRAHHAPLACRWLASKDERVRGVARDAVWAAMGYSDDHREEIARAVLSAAGVELREEDPLLERARALRGRGRSGLPPLLVAVLRLAFLSELDEKRLGKGIVSVLPSWTLRWLGDEVPGLPDLTLLDAIASRLEAPDAGAGYREHPDYPALSVVLRAVRRARGAVRSQRLEAYREKGDPFAATSAVEAFERSGGRDPVALALLLKRGPVLASAVVRRLAEASPAARSGLVAALGRLGRTCRRFRIRLDAGELSALAASLANDLPGGPFATRDGARGGGLRGLSGVRGRGSAPA